MENYNLERFLEAQETAYPYALKELKQGQKRSHWIWYIFPQLKGLGRSYNSEFYDISGLDEAKAYLDHPILNQRLREVCEVILGLPTDDAAACSAPYRVHSQLVNELANDDLQVYIVDGVEINLLINELVNLISQVYLQVWEKAETDQSLMVADVLKCLIQRNQQVQNRDTY